VTATARTDENGRYVVADLLEGEYTVITRSRDGVPGTPLGSAESSESRGNSCVGEYRARVGVPES
ncbi:hypothetical protein, partial [Nocardia sp. NPDC003648]